MPVPGIALAEQRAVAAPAPVERERLRGCREDGPQQVQEVGLQPGDLHPIAQQGTGGSDEVGGPHRAEVAVDVEEPADHAGHRDGAAADVELLTGGAEVDEDRFELDRVPGESPLRRVHEEVVDPGAAAGGHGEEEPAPAEGRQRRDAEHEAGRRWW